MTTSNFNFFDLLMQTLSKYAVVLTKTLLCVTLKVNTVYNLIIRQFCEKIAIALARHHTKLVFLCLLKISKINKITKKAKYEVREQFKPIHWAI